MKNLHTIWVFRNCVQHTLWICNSIKGIFPLYFPLSGNVLLYHCPWKSSLWQNTTFLAKRQLGWYSHLGLVLYLIKRVVANFSKKLLMSGYNSPEPLLPNHRKRKYTSTSPQRSWAHPNPRFSRKISLYWHMHGWRNQSQNKNTSFASPVSPPPTSTRWCRRTDGGRINFCMTFSALFLVFTLTV